MYNPQQTEKEILEFWSKNNIFNKLREKNKGKKKWSFIDGPITANNPMGVHHAWGRTYKDLFQRFKAMQGFDQRFQNGFDCQGLWVEREEEKDLGLKNKEDIERFGVLNFVNSCKKRVEKFSKIQRDQSIRLGQWMDWENSYYTMSDDNNLHNWHLLKTYFDKGWLYKGKDAVPWCWRCGTASSKHDITTEGYKETTHTALFMQFPLKNNPDEYFLIFTTTPWTVPANVAIAVNPNIDYVKVENEGLKYWLAEARVSELEGEHTILEKKKGNELEGLEYLMPYYDLEQQKESPHKVVLWDLASGDEGTGIVHIAPGCGAEDFDLGKKIGLPAISPLNEAGIYGEGFGQFSLKKYLEVNKEVLSDLEQRRFVYKTKSYRHRYPHCWRCGNELVFRLVSEWYVKCEKIRKILLKENKKVIWSPEYGKVRQEEWIKNMGDWLISRKRYWGLPLPIWECKSCPHLEVIGSLEELKEKAIDKNKVEDLPEIHRPWIDEIKIKCSRCEKEMQRVKDVGDAWLDAGIVPFSTLNYLNDKKYWDEWFPADFICENLPGQFRGWFNALFWASAALTGKTPFKSLLGYETLKDEKGEEMHKSKGNAIWFDEAVEKVGADPIRLLYCLQDPAQELRFGYTVLKEPSNNLNILENISRLVSPGTKKKIKKIEDKWILSRLHSLIKKVTEELENLHPHQATRALQEFWLKDFSRVYIKIVRERIAEDDDEVKNVLNEVYISLLKMLAPITPFLTEKIWQILRGKEIVNEESIHLSNWPKVINKNIDENLEKEFEKTLKIIELGLAERDKAKIGLRWPLARATIKGKVGSEMKEIITRQLNIKEINFGDDSKELSIEIDISPNAELEAEGFTRELARKIQAERKNKGLIKSDIIKLNISCEPRIKSMFKNNTNFLKERVNAVEIEFIDEISNKDLTSIKIKESIVSFFFS
ncbi:MAG: isoleucine--tRNA ligase [Nanoarchaeota archaeon]|nr:isoleucine--tRNA ligase [Nanoarchaeota archaeon]